MGDPLPNETKEDEACKQTNIMHSNIYKRCNKNTQKSSMVQSIHFTNLPQKAQLRFQLYQSHSLTATGLKNSKKSKYWVSVGILNIIETSM